MTLHVGLPEPAVTRRRREVGLDGDSESNRLADAGGVMTLTSSKSSERRSLTW
jgi:hypothetical protein